ncbi:malto-oligosyltrehalose trehalohydrolase [Rhabdochromatium marinum]|nr:malto-oligosyltrehalose trehalohydrolase [Rhabdochromatium marinum]
MPFGCERDTEGHFCFRLWAPAVRELWLELELASGQGTETVAMESAGDGWYWYTSAVAQPGDRYCFRLPSGLCVPDPASRFQPLDVHGPSQVVDPESFAWQDSGWRGRPWHETVIYELHIGSFSPTGDFAGVEARLDALEALGITAIELMPVADFPGRWNWGYDGALLFAPDSRYGQPENLKRLVQAAHQRGLMVFLDVVYNHFGPEGNYLHCYAPEFFHPDRHTPWGAALHFDGPHSAPVREFFICNALYWLTEYRFDGLRFDAVDRILDDSKPDLLDALAARVQAGPGAERHIHLVLENDHNDARRYRRDRSGRPRQFTAQWNDDAHHALHAALTGESEGVYQDYAAAPWTQLGRALAEGFCYQGEPSAFRGGQPRGTSSADLPPQAFVNFLQNHDQIGNRAQGERLEHLIPAPAFEAALAVFLLAPAPPLLFMGQEFAASTPFVFFCDLEPDLMVQVAAGRRREFAGQAAFSDPARLHALPDPGDPQTFHATSLDWTQRESSPGQERWALHQRLLRVRAQYIRPLLPRLTQSGDWWQHSPTGLSWRWRTRDGSQLYLSTNLGSQPLRCASDHWSNQLTGTPIYQHPAKTGHDWPPYWVSCWITDADGVNRDADRSAAKSAQTDAADAGSGHRC